jgi:hypothetical protein
MLKIYAHSEASYAARTRYNTEVSDLTAAFALDFTTSGELMTKRAAGDKLVEIPLTLEWIEAARVLWKALRQRDAHTLNIAGNGLSTLALHGGPKAGSTPSFTWLWQKWPSTGPSRRSSRADRPAPTSQA